MVSIAPPLVLRCSTSDDLIAISRNPLPVKRRSSDTPLPNVNGIVGGNKPFAEQHLHPANGPFFHKCRSLIDQNLADVLRIVYEDDRRPEELVAGDVAIGAVQMLKKQNWAAELYPWLKRIKGK